MIKIDEVIEKHDKNSRALKRIYLGNEDLNYDETIRLREQQDNEYKKMMFFKNLKKGMVENEKQNRSIGNQKRR